MGVAGGVQHGVVAGAPGAEALPAKGADNALVTPTFGLIGPGGVDADVVEGNSGGSNAVERALWRMYAPHKVKLAVSGCPRNCAEAGIKDVGVIGVDSGWEMYVAGNGGIKTEVAHFFTKLKTAEEVLEYTGAFCELYRQEGWYLERTVHYVNRVGLDYVKKRILEDHEGRKALWEQLQFALDGEPDPWFDFDKAAVDTRQFAPLSA